MFPKNSNFKTKREPNLYSRCFEFGFKMFETID